MIEKFSDTAIFKFYPYPKQRGQRAIFTGTKELAKEQLKNITHSVLVEVIDNDIKSSFVYTPEVKKSEIGATEYNEFDNVYDWLEEHDDILEEHTKAINDIIAELIKLKQQKATEISGFFRELTTTLKQPQTQLPGQAQMSGTNYNSTIEDQAKNLASKRQDAAELLAILNKIADTEPNTLDQLKAYYLNK